MDSILCCVFSVLLCLCYGSSSRFQRESLVREEIEKCPEFCPFVWNPVCGSDHTTYDNACRLQATACLDSKELRVEYEGVCHDRFPNEASCLLWKHCKNTSDSGKICGSNGIVYVNTCYMMQESCRENVTIFQIPCSKIDPHYKDVLVPSRSPPHSSLVSSYLNVLPTSSGQQRHPKQQESLKDTNPNSDNCLPDLTCSRIYYPVCGSDGNTYENECLLQGLSRCKRKNALVKAFTGDCDKEDKDISESCNSFNATQCPTVYDPVCGIDGRTYTNECYMMATSCTENELIIKRHDGVCKNNSNLRKLRLASIIKECPFACNLIYQPVCGSDGQTYANKCQFESKNCLTSTKTLSIVSQGPCDDPIYEFEPSIAEEDPILECPKFCTFEFIPVCGSDGVTYSNKCHLQSQSCKSGNNIEMDHPGQCDDPFEAVITEEEEEEENDDKCPVFCSFTHEEVCGTDGTTYRNLCHLKYQSCQYPEDNIKKASNGPCNSKDKLTDDSNVCPVKCPNDYSPICGSNGLTYVNECQLKLANCNNQNDSKIKISYYGSCLDKCPEFCATKYEPVCGSDGITYVNDCHLLAGNCRHDNKYIFLLDLGECSPKAQIISDTYEERSIRPNDNSLLQNTCNTGEVCGSDGKTYSSVCEIIEANRNLSVKIYKVYGGKCTCPQVCSFNDEPVCGSDGIIYPNLCEFQIKMCSLFEDNKLGSEQLFLKIKGRQCKDHLKEDRNEINVIKDCMKDMPEFCSTDYDPVCGSNGKSYANVCQMKKQGCLTRNPNVTVYHFGLCYCQRRDNYCNVANDKPFCGVGENNTYESLCDLEFQICENMATSSSPSTFPIFESLDESCLLPNSHDLKYCDIMKCESWPLFPICTSNGKSFANECYFKKYKCYQLMENEDRMKVISNEDFANNDDIKRVKNGVCDVNDPYTILLKDDYYNDEESFLDSRLKNILYDFLSELKERMSLQDYEMYHLIDVRQKETNTSLVTASLILRRSEDSESTSFKKCILSKFITENIIENDECTDISRESGELEKQGMNVDITNTCNRDGRFYYPNQKVENDFVLNSSETLILEKANQKCCPQCNESSMENKDTVVCGSDGVTYVSKCQFKRYICLKNSNKRNLFFLYNGPCFLEKDVIANISTQNPTNNNVKDIKRKLFSRYFSQKYPRWNIRNIRTDGLKTYNLFLFERFCFDRKGRQKSEEQCRSSLYGQRKMICKVGIQKDRVVQENCNILEKMNRKNSINQGAAYAVKVISKELNDTNTWILSSVGKTGIQTIQKNDSKLLMDIYLTMTRSENCDQERDNGQECSANDSSPVNFCDAQIEKSKNKLKLISKICAGYKVEQFFRYS